MSKRHKKEDRCPVVEAVTDRCDRGVFGNIICLIIILIVLQFLCGVLAEEEDEKCEC